MDKIPNSNNDESESYSVQAAMSLSRGYIYYVMMKWENAHVYIFCTYLPIQKCTFSVLLTLLDTYYIHSYMIPPKHQVFYEQFTFLQSQRDNLLSNS